MAWVCPKCGCGNLDEYETCIRCDNPVKDSVVKLID